MQPLKYSLYDLLKEIYEFTKRELCERVFIEERPTVSNENFSDFVVISLPSGLQSYGVWQDGVLRFEIYARNRDNGQPNLRALQDILDNLTTRCPIKGRRWMAWKPRVVLRGADNAGFTVWNVQCDFRVYTTDRLV